MSTTPLDAQTSQALDAAFVQLLRFSLLPNVPLGLSISQALNPVWSQTGLGNTAVLAGAPAGSTPTLTVGGVDTNVGLTLALKGSGDLNLGTGSNQVTIGWGGTSSIYASDITSAPGHAWTSGNALVMQFGATGVDPRIIVSGYDANPNLVLQGQGTGALKWLSPGDALLMQVDAQGTMTLTGGFIAHYVAHGATGNIAATEFIAGCTADGITLTLPVGTLGQLIIINDETGGAGTSHITINAPAGGTLDGAASQSIAANYGVMRVYCASANGLTWFEW